MRPAPATSVAPSAAVGATRACGGDGDRTEVSWDSAAETVGDDRDAELALRVGPRPGPASAEVAERVRVRTTQVDEALAERKTNPERNRSHVADFEAERKRDDRES